MSDRGEHDITLLDKPSGYSTDSLKALFAHGRVGM
jgi:hypothetical protein